MIIKNLLRRKGRTLLTAVGISVGVAAIILLGALANGLGSGYQSIITGANADLVITQPDSLDVSLSGIDQDIGETLAAMSEVKAVSGMVQGIVNADDSPYFFLFGYETDSFILDRFKIVDGVGLGTKEAEAAKGTPIIIGTAAAEALNKNVGDSIRLTSSVYRIVGIYETGSAFEDGGGILPLEEAQRLLGRVRQVGAFYIQLKDPALRDRVIERNKRLYPDLSTTTASDFADNQIIGEAMDIYVIVIGGMAIVIGGVTMTNSQLMAVFERTREIGVLRAVGWTSKRVLRMILSESMLVSMIGGLGGLGLGLFALKSLDFYLVAYGASLSSVDSTLLLKALIIVILLGFIGGYYPARRASQLKPIEALRYEGGGSGGTQKRFPIGGMAVQSLWQRSVRTLLTMGAIGLTIASIFTLEVVVAASTNMINGLSNSSGAEVILRQANVADTSQSVIDESISQRIAALPEVKGVSGLVFSVVVVDETNLFLIQGLDPNEFGIRHFKIVEGEPLRANHQLIVGRSAAEALNISPGDTLELAGRRFKVVGIYETGVAFEELGGVMTTRDAQVFTGKPRKVTLASVKLNDPTQAEALVDKINANFPEVHATLSGDFANELPDMKAMSAMMGAVSFITVLVGGVGIMNTMLMAVLERTREIGALRALGWRRRNIIGLIIRESTLLGVLGGILGIILAIIFVFAIAQIQAVGDIINTQVPMITYIRALGLSLALGLLGGIYPAYRATRMQPVEALRYE